MHTHENKKRKETKKGWLPKLINLAFGERFLIFFVRRTTSEISLGNRGSKGWNVIFFEPCIHYLKIFFYFFVCVFMYFYFIFLYFLFIFPFLFKKETENKPQPGHSTTFHEREGKEKEGQGTRYKKKVGRKDEKEHKGEELRGRAPYAFVYKLLRAQCCVMRTWAPWICL